MNGNMRRVVGWIMLAWISGASPQAPGGPPNQPFETNVPKPNTEIHVDLLKAKETSNIPSNTPEGASTGAINQVLTQTLSTPQKPNKVSEDTHTNNISSIPIQTEVSKTDNHEAQSGDGSDYKHPTQTTSPTSQDIPPGQINEKDHLTSAKPGDPSGVPPQESQPPMLTTSPDSQEKQETPNEKLATLKENENANFPIDMPEKLNPNGNDGALQNDNQPPTLTTSSSPQANESTTTVASDASTEAEKASAPISEEESPTSAKETPKEKQPSLDVNLRILDQPKDESPPESMKPPTKSPDAKDSDSQYKREPSKESPVPNEITSDEKEATDESDQPSHKKASPSKTTADDSANADDSSRKSSPNEKSLNEERTLEKSKQGKDLSVQPEGDRTDEKDVGKDLQENKIQESLKEVPSTEKDQYEEPDRGPESEKNQGSNTEKGEKGESPDVVKEQNADSTKDNDSSGTGQETAKTPTDQEPQSVDSETDVPTSKPSEKDKSPKEPAKDASNFDGKPNFGPVDESPQDKAKLISGEKEINPQTTDAKDDIPPKTNNANDIEKGRVALEPPAIPNEEAKEPNDNNLASKKDSEKGAEKTGVKNEPPRIPKNDAKRPNTEKKTTAADDVDGRRPGDPEKSKIGTLPPDTSLVDGESKPPSPDVKFVGGEDADVKLLPSEKKHEEVNPSPEGKPGSKGVDPDQIAKGERGKDQNPESIEKKQDQGNNLINGGQGSAKTPTDQEPQGVDAETDVPTSKPSEKDTSPKEPAKDASNFDGKPNFGPVDESPQDKAKPISGKKEINPQTTDAKDDIPPKTNNGNDIEKGRVALEPPAIPNEEAKEPNDNNLASKKDSKKVTEKDGVKDEPPRVPKNDAKRPNTEKKTTAADDVDGRRPGDPEKSKIGTLPPDTSLVDGESKLPSTDAKFVGEDTNAKPLPSEKKHEEANPSPEGKPGSKGADSDQIAMDDRGKDQNPESIKKKQGQGDNLVNGGQDSSKTPTDQELQGVDAETDVPTSKPSEKDSTPKEPAKDASNFDGKPDFGPGSGSPQDKPKPISSEKEINPQTTDVKDDIPSKANNGKDIEKGRDAREPPAIPNEEAKELNDNNLASKKDPKKGTEKTGVKDEPPRVPKNDAKKPNTEKKATAADDVDGRRPGDPEKSKKDSLPPDTWFVDGEDKPPSPDSWFVDGEDSDAKPLPSEKKHEEANPSPEGKPGNKGADSDQIAMDDRGKSQNPESIKNKQAQGDNPDKGGQDSSKSPSDKGSKGMDSDKPVPKPKISEEDNAPKESPSKKSSPESKDPIAQEPTQSEPRAPTEEIPDKKPTTGNNTPRIKDSSNFNGKPNFGSTDESSRDKNKPTPSEKEASSPRTKDTNDVMNDIPTRVSPVKENGKERDGEGSLNISNKDNVPNRKEPEKNAEKEGENEKPKGDKKSPGAELEKGENPKDADASPKDQLPPDTWKVTEERGIKPQPSEKNPEEIKPDMKGKPEGSDDSKELPKNKQDGTSSFDKEKPTVVVDAQPSTSRKEVSPSLPTRLQPSSDSDPALSKDSSKTSLSESSPTAQPSKANHDSSSISETIPASKTSASPPAQPNKSSKSSAINPTTPTQSPKENQDSPSAVETDSDSKTSETSPAQPNESSKPSAINPTAPAQSPKEKQKSSSAVETNPVSKTSATAQPKESSKPSIAVSTQMEQSSTTPSTPPVQTEPAPPNEEPQRLPDPVNTFVIEKGNVRLPVEQEPKEPPKDVKPSRTKRSASSPTEDTNLEPTTPDYQPKPEPTAEEAPEAIPARPDPPPPSTSSEYIFSQPVYLKPNIKVTAEEAPVATATSLPIEEKLTPDKPSMIRGTDDNVVEGDDVGFEIRLLNVRYMDLLDFPDKSKHISNALPQDLGFLTGQKSSKFHVIEMKPNNPNRLTSDQSIIVIISISNREDGDAIPIMEALNHDIASKAEMLKDTIVLKLIDPSIIERGIQGFVLVNSSAKDRSNVPMDFDFISKSSNTKEEAFGAVPNPLTNLDGPQTPWKPLSDESGGINWATKSIALSLALTSALVYALLVLFRIHYPQHFMIR